MARGHSRSRRAWRAADDWLSHLQVSLYGAGFGGKLAVWVLLLGAALLTAGISNGDTVLVSVGGPIVALVVIATIHNHFRWRPPAAAPDRHGGGEERQQDPR